MKVLFGEKTKLRINSMALIDAACELAKEYTGLVPIINNGQIIGMEEDGAE